MKILKNILIFIFTIILSIAISVLVFTNLLSSTILNKEYVLSKLDETDYYNQIYNYVETNFEKYLYQSGFDEDVLKNLITVDQIKEDTNKILNNIYDNSKEDVSTENLQTNLNEKINSFLDENNLTANQNDIDSFVNTICKEYSNSISHYKYEEKIFNGYEKIVKFVQKAGKATKGVIAISIIILLLINIKQILKFFTYIGVSSFASGMFLFVVNAYIRKRIDIKNILILNDAISLWLRNLAESMLNIITKNASIFTIIGFILILISTAILSIKEPEKEEN